MHGVVIPRCGCTRQASNFAHWAANNFTMIIFNPRKTWIEGVQAAMTTRNLEPDQWRNREEWRLVSGRWRQLLKNRIAR